MRKSLPVLLFLWVLTHGAALAQKEASHWFFGNRAGFDFRQGPPALVHGSAMPESDYGCAAMSDKATGELLFYTNGYNIWNREHRRMPSARDWPENCGSHITQSALIVPVPDNPHRYYLFSLSFTVKNPEDPYAECRSGLWFGSQTGCDVSYSIVDMRLDNGLGDVLEGGRKVPLQRNATEKLTAVPHANGRDFWVITHAMDSDAFHVYLVSPEGVSPHAVIRIGSVHRRAAGPDSSSAAKFPESMGYLKASPDGRKLACAIHLPNEERPFDLFDFDPATGQISNYLNLGQLLDQYGVSFSPDNSKLYVSTFSPLGSASKDVIRQYDLLAGSPDATKASGKSLLRGNTLTNIPNPEAFDGFAHPLMGLQLALDGKVYATANNRQEASVSRRNGIVVIIHKPNEAGFGADINYREYDFGDRDYGTGTGLPNFIQSYFNGLGPLDGAPACDLAALLLYPNPTTGTVQVRASEAGCALQLELRVCNSIGQTMLTRSFTGGTDVRMQGWASGVYLFTLSSPEGTVTRKVFKTPVNE